VEPSGIPESVGADEINFSRMGTKENIDDK
jgi:hypothetical protein